MIKTKYTYRLYWPWPKALKNFWSYDCFSQKTLTLWFSPLIIYLLTYLAGFFQNLFWRCKLFWVTANNMFIMFGKFLNFGVGCLGKMPSLLTRKLWWFVIGERLIREQNYLIFHDFHFPENWLAMILQVSTELGGWVG